MARRKRGRPSKGGQGGSMWGSLTGIVNALVAVGIAIGFGYFLCYTLQAAIGTSYLAANGYIENATGVFKTDGSAAAAASVTTALAAIRAPFTTVMSGIGLVAALLGVIVLVVVVKGFIMPMIGA